jgi:hypothetical protein
VTIQESGKGPRPIPIIMRHGWPWTAYDFHKVIRPLSDPAAFGGDPAAAFGIDLAGERITVITNFRSSREVF